MEKMAEEVSENRKSQNIFSLLDKNLFNRKNFSVKVSLEIKQMMSEPIIGEPNPEPSDPTDKAILVLNTKPFAAKPLVFDLNGKLTNKKETDMT